MAIYVQKRSKTLIINMSIDTDDSEEGELNNVWVYFYHIIYPQLTNMQLYAEKLTITDKISWHTSLKRGHLTSISFICHLILFKRRKSPHPRINVVCSKRKTWGSKIQHWF